MPNGIIPKGFQLPKIEIPETKKQVLHWKDALKSSNDPIQLDPQAISNWRKVEVNNSSTNKALDSSEEGAGSIGNKATVTKESLGACKNFR